MLLLNSNEMAVFSFNYQDDKNWKVKKKKKKR